jgi:hypothetical protein
MKLDFERTVKNLDALHKMDFPHNVVLSTVGYPNEEFRKYCYERWPKFESMAIKRVAWLGFTNAQDLTVPDEPCSRWFELSIMATGEVATCCMHDGQDKRWIIGDVNKQTMLEIYNSPHWRMPRESLIGRKKLGDAYPCRQCEY